MILILKLRRIISIHALHEESDFIGVSQPHDGDISIHALHEESDSFVARLLHLVKFQSTLSMRRATWKSTSGRLSTSISIHALHEESDGLATAMWSAVTISIHALHEESDAPIPSL